jgi:hypothetical protein
LLIIESSCQVVRESQLNAIRASQYHHGAPKIPNQNSGWPKRHAIATRKMPTGNSLMATGNHSKSVTVVAMHPARCNRGKM